ncbi:MAG: hypothetical protein LBS50_09720 [Prevotellaceae bacterium]|jgi:hypothetical protein|nr:hypothetical protein [Prevotellaceae bacterium]
MKVLLFWIAFIIVGAVLQGWLGTPNEKTGYKPERRTHKPNGKTGYDPEYRTHEPSGSIICHTPEEDITYKPKRRRPFF